MLSAPALGGGIRSVSDMFAAYLRLQDKDLDLMIQYGKMLGNGAVFKRLGFLLETLAPDETAARELCRENLTSGNSRLDPKLKADNLITRWRLWVPESWVPKKDNV